MNNLFESQVALVTGASRGIGRAVAMMLGSRGATVIGTATSATGADGIRKAFEEKGISGAAKVLDVASPASIEALFEELGREGLAPAILVNNAGITRDNLAIRMKEAEWQDVIDTDLTAVYRMTRKCLKAMMKSRYGRIINISSVVALSGNAGQVNYSAAKAGLIGFSKSLAWEVGSRGITVNVVAPGMVVTDMTGELTDARQLEMAGRTALGRLGEAGEVAEAVCFLAAPATGYITGETINVNGGLYMA